MTACAVRSRHWTATPCCLSPLFRYTQILQIIAVVLITFGLVGKVFNCIIFLRKPVRVLSLY